MSRLLQPLPEGALDIIGDVHGELHALERLLHRLGVDVERRTARRPVVFVGDLVDRGPDSVGVIELVSRLMDAGIAHAVLGNHELNLLRRERKEGNGWFHGDSDEFAQSRDGPIPFGSRVATTRDQEAVLAFFASLPLMLQREDLQVVHACAHPHSLAQLPEVGDVARLCDEHEARITAHLRSTGLLEEAEAQRRTFAGLKRRDIEPTAHLLAVALCDEAEQNDNPIKVLTSGLENAVAVGKPLFAGGKWRFVRRVDWWNDWQGRPTVIGHYWRSRHAVDSNAPFHDVGQFGWASRVFCVDYSVGSRYVERARPRAVDFHNGLAALRWPERELVFDDREPPPLPTVGFSPF
jgi:hypothetical protein